MHRAIVFGLVLAGCSGSGREKPPAANGGSPDLGPSAPAGGCDGLTCFQKDCGAQPPTTVSGRVTAPNGLDPVYDALVYVPTNVPEFPPGAQCEVCGEPIGGVPIVSTHTAVDGTFVLANVPATSKVPIVVQKGRFRRTVSLDVNACSDNKLPAALARLPRKQSEGDLPRMAVGVGDYDQIECVLRSIGIDESEFTPPTGNGAVHLYDNAGGQPSLESLIYDASKLAEYNLLFVNCTNTTFDTYANQTLAKQNLHKYVSGGGRLYVTDWAYDYMEQVPEFAPYVFFDGGGDMTHPQPVKAAEFAWNGSDLQAQLGDPTLAMWMKAAKASATGSLPIVGSWALALSTSTDANFPSTTWVHGVAGGKDRPMTVTFDYNMCGKVLWSSYHTQEPGGAGSAFPSYCKSTPSTMIAQEKVLEYLIFQISACVGTIG